MQLIQLYLKIIPRKIVLFVAIEVLYFSSDPLLLFQKYGFKNL